VGVTTVGVKTIGVTLCTTGVWVFVLVGILVDVADGLSVLAAFKLASVRESESAPRVNMIEPRAITIPQKT
jgi:hypothetical protein